MSSATITLNFHSDPGHGWLEAPMSLVRKLGIAPKVSHYSYTRGNNTVAYLEEDCDAPLLVNALKEQLDIGVEFKEAHSDDDSFIRRLPRFVG